MSKVENITLKEGGYNYDYICEQDNRFALINSYNLWEIRFNGKSITFIGSLKQAKETLKDILNNGYFQYYNKEFGCPSRVYIGE